MALADSVTAGLAELEPLDVRDQALADLAITYALAIDLGEAELTDAGPKLLAALTALQMTPAARAAATKGARPTASPLDELRARRAARATP